jgi:predicted N-acetyltransferase YhbS
MSLCRWLPIGEGFALTRPPFGPIRPAFFGAIPDASDHATPATIQPRADPAPRLNARIGGLSAFVMIRDQNIGLPFIVTPMTASTAPARAAPPRTPILLPERPRDAPLVVALIDRAFGPGRYVKTAERLREHNTPLLDISFVAWLDEQLVGCVRMWPVHIGEQAAVFLGPFAVEPAFRSLGVGGALIERACVAAAEAGNGLILLVGDAPYFEPLGFSKAPVGRIVMPGPVDAHRLLIRPLAEGAADGLAGRVRAG